MNREMKAWAWLLELEQLDSGSHSQITIKVRPRDRRVPDGVPVVQLQVFVRLPGKGNIAEIEVSGVSLFEAVDRAHRELWGLCVGGPCLWASDEPGLYRADDPLMGPTGPYRTDDPLMGPTGPCIKDPAKGAYGPCADGVHR